MTRPDGGRWRPRRAGGGSAPAPDRAGSSAARLPDRAGRRWSPAGVAALLAPVLLVLLLLGPSLLGLRLFAAGDLIDSRAPWAEASPVEHVRNSCVSDTIDGALPHELTFRDRVAGGDLAPLWDNSASAGIPLAAAPFQGVVSPLFLATLPLPDAAFTGWLKLFEVLVILAGTVAWGRRIGLSVPAGVLGGFLYATGSFMVMWTNWPQSRTAAFFPLLFWAMERIVQDRTVRSALPLPLVITGLVLGGFPAIAVHAVYLAAAYAVVRLVCLNRGTGTRADRAGTATGRPGAAAHRPRPEGAWRRWVKPPLLAAGGGAVAVLLTGFQLLPAAQQLAATDLSRRANAWTATLGWPETVTTVFPQALGTCQTGDARWGTYIPTEGISFVGAGTLVLCLAALTLPAPNGRMRGVRPFLAAGAGLVLAATFLGGPVNYLLHFLPFMDSSGLHRMRGVGGLLLAMLAAVGLDAVARSRRHHGRAAWAGLLTGPVLLVAAAVAAYRLTPGPQEWAQARPGVLFGLVVGLGVAAAWGLVMVGRARATRAVALTVIPLLLAADGLVFASAMWPRTDPAQLYRPTTTDAYLEANLGHERMVGVQWTYWAGAGSVAGLRSLSGHVFVPQDWRDLLLRADKHMFASNTFHSLSSVPALRSPVLDRFAVRYGVADTPTVPPGEFHGDGEQDLARAVTLQDAPGGRTEPAGTPLRGAVVEVVTPVGDVPEAGDPGHLVVEAVAADGEVLAEGRRRLRDGEGGRLTVPVAGEDLARTTEPYTVRVRAEGGPELRVAAAGGAAGAQAGGAWVGTVVGAGDGLSLVATSEAQVYQRTTALPRFRWAQEARACAGVDACAELMGQVPATTVLLPPGDLGEVDLDGQPADVAVAVDQDDYQRVRVRAEGAGVLVVADGFQEDWVARVDGAEVPILRADHAMRGVPVPAGEHVVELSYHPVGWTVLPWVALAAGVGLAAVWVVLVRRDRRGRPG
ncbi:hypothetical protein MF406_05820 [Georgenia sp. TF02-10]|uniref:hypothetical protein n=1 Tax=Georgenia sp. TF02-10 TaxID=2917725 RepID=UPI001FA772C3|nr:hypothetical protein [Georgenia sp. TF02-10]UNX55752.1 hypothetical protein MF406_05820 [Georgenia sp. TF02-10]